ncbi:hypothetical protein ACRQ5Q_42220 (plasmid) [Bradyrhizobium sp. PMVTL-01]
MSSDKKPAGEVPASDNQESADRLSLIKEYINDLREIIKKLRKKLN